MTETDIQEELQRRLKMALAEAGYPNANVFWNRNVGAVHVTVDNIDRPEWKVPWQVVQRAFEVCAPQIATRLWETDSDPQSVT